MAEHLMRDRAVAQWHSNQALLGTIDALANRLGNFVGLAQAITNQTVLIAGDHQRAEAEAPATFDDLGHTVDVDHLLFDIHPLRVNSLCHGVLPAGCQILESESGFARRVGQRLNSSMIEKAIAVEYHLADAMLATAIGDRLADRLGCRDVAQTRAALAHFLDRGRSRRQR